MSNLYQNKVYAVFGHDLGSKILKLIDPCSISEVDCNLYKDCETNTTFGLNPLNPNEICYENEAGIKSCVEISTISLSSLNYDPTTGNISLTLSDNTVLTTNIQILTTVDTTSIDHNYDQATGILSSTVIIDGDSTNQLSITSNGLYVPAPTPFVETITSISANIDNTNPLNPELVITYTNEDGSQVPISVDLSSLLDNVDTNTTYTITDNSNGTFTFAGSDSTSTIIDICAIVAANCPETNTTISYVPGTNILTYTSEDGTAVNITLNSSVVSNTITGNTIATHTSSDGTVVDINETVTAIAYNGANGELSFTDESGTVNVITIPVENFLQAASYNSVTHNLTLSLVNGTTFDVPLDDLVDEYTIVDNGDNTYNLQDGLGNNIGATISAKPSVITNTVVGNLIGTHTSGDGTVVSINETITTLSDQGDGSIRFIGENGATTDISLCNLVDDLADNNTQYLIDDKIIAHTAAGDCELKSIPIHKTVCMWYDGLDGTSSTLVLPLNMSGIVNADIKDVRFIYNGVEQQDSSQISITTALGTEYTWALDVAGTVLTVSSTTNLGEAFDPCWAKICVVIEK